MYVHLTIKSRNEKTGPIPVSTTSDDTCPPACPFRKGPCYAEQGPLSWHWNKVTAGLRGSTWSAFCGQVKQFPKLQLWRHNQAGDLPGDGDEIDGAMLLELVMANVERKGFTYTHKPLTAKNARQIAAANNLGFTINLSANNLQHADELSALDIAPVAVVLPQDSLGNVKTPQGRDVIQCPATYEESKVTCASCGFCAVNMAGNKRRKIVGFPAHGISKAKATAIVSN